MAVPAVYWPMASLAPMTTSSGAASARRYVARRCRRHPRHLPRGVTIEGADDSHDFGLKAGFYIDATELKWAGHYKMESHITDELPALVEAHQGKIAPGKRSIFGHSMGGHGALTLALKHQTMYTSVSAFAPICHPTNCRGAPRPLMATSAALTRARLTMLSS